MADEDGHTGALLHILSESNQSDANLQPELRKLDPQYNESPM
jgi:hypothetical protein